MFTRLTQLALALLLFIFVTPLLRGAEWPDRIFTPYAYLGASTPFQLTACNDACGQKYYVLAFIVADKQNNPAWDGFASLDRNPYADQIAAIRQRGGDIIASFGGEAGKELALAEKNATALQAKYQAVIDRYKVTWLDFDIEGNGLSKTEANVRRNAVLAKLQAANPGLRISYTLPVSPNGISDDSQHLLTDAKAQGVKVYSVNIMTMYFGKEWMQKQKMIGLCETSAVKAREQIQGIDSSVQIGLTPCIGQNGDEQEIFSEDDAAALEKWAVAQPWICSLSFWSVNRDAGTPGKVSDDVHSGISQPAWTFTKLFQNFAAH